MSGLVRHIQKVQGNDDGEVYQVWYTENGVQISDTVQRHEVLAVAAEYALEALTYYIRHHCQEQRHV
jgi:hypothetical protein